MQFLEKVQKVLNENKGKGVRQLKNLHGSIKYYNRWILKQRRNVLSHESLDIFQALASTNAGWPWGRPKPLECLHFLGPYPAIAGESLGPKEKKTSF